MRIRLYKDSDYEEICSWWAHHNEPIPPKDLISEFTYILEKSGVPWICLSLITFNVEHIAWSAGLVSNPKCQMAGRKDAVKMLWDHVAQVAKEMGYNNLLCIAPNKKLEKRYRELGFEITKTNQTFMVKNLGE